MMAPAPLAHEVCLYRWRRAYTPRQEAQHRDRVRFCQSRPWQLTAWERSFVTGIARLHGNLSIRQGDRLAALTDASSGKAGAHDAESRPDRGCPTRRGKRRRHRDRVRFCQSRPWQLTAWERSFVTGIARLHGNL
ncbi:hypothetical protein CTI14_18085, partial [Methylobacterium radiotolerans]